MQSDASTSGRRVASLEGSQRAASGSLAANNAAQTGLLELQRRADALQVVYDTFLNASKQSTAEAQVVQPDSRIVSRAEQPHKPSFPNWIYVIPFGLLAGGLFGLMSVAGLEMLRDGCDSVADVELRLNVASAGIIPQLSSVIRAKVGGGSRPTAICPSIRSRPSPEAFRSLRTYLMLPGGEASAPYIIAVTSALPGEGKSVTAIGLAQTLALAGARTLLIDCDLRRRGVTTTLGGSGPGVVELLTSKAQPRRRAALRRAHRAHDHPRLAERGGAGGLLHAGAGRCAVREVAGPVRHRGDRHRPGAGDRRHPRDLCEG